MYCEGCESQLPAPHHPNEEPKEICVRTCQDLQERLERDAEFLFMVIIYDAMCVCRYGPETKQQLSQRLNHHLCDQQEPEQFHPDCAWKWSSQTCMKLTIAKCIVENS